VWLVGCSRIAADGELFGMPLSNPVGMAAGFDKDGQAIDGGYGVGLVLTA
jgi:dihydroorotate dehydrogenase